MEEIGKVLANKRKDMRYTLKEVSEHLKIREQYLEYIEKAELDKIPGRVYVKGYIRQYAKLLNLKELDALENLQFGNDSNTIKDERSKNISLNFMPNKIIFFASILTIFFIYLFYSRI